MVMGLPEEVPYWPGAGRLCTLQIIRALLIIGSNEVHRFPRGEEVAVSCIIHYSCLEFLAALQLSGILLRCCSLFLRMVQAGNQVILLLYVIKFLAFHRAEHIPISRRTRPEFLDCLIKGFFINHHDKVSGPRLKSRLKYVLW